MTRPPVFGIGCQPSPIRADYPSAQADGVSLVPTLTGVGNQRSRGFLYWEYEFNFKPQFKVDKELFARKHVRGRGQLQSIRIGDFTAVRYGVSNAAAPFSLNVVTDPHEDHDLAGDPAYADRVAQAETMTKEVRRAGSRSAAAL